MIGFEKGYPLWKVEYEEKLYHDVLSKEYSIFVKPHSQVSHMRLYITSSLPKAMLALERLKEIYPTIVEKVIKSEDNQPAMFEVHNQIYKTTFVLLGQSCICGEIIEGNKHYGAIEDNYDLKFDYTQDFVFFYDYGDCLVHSNQLFLNGELILNEEQLCKICAELGQDIEHLETEPHKLLRWLAINYPDAKTYICGGSTYYDVGGYING
jgi:hypothetical protein